jgi:hypothetical protein
MLSDHGGEFESVEARHTDIQENHRDFGLEQMLKRLGGR